MKGVIISAVVFIMCASENHGQELIFHRTLTDRLQTNDYTYRGIYSDSLLSCTSETLFQSILKRAVTIKEKAEDELLDKTRHCGDDECIVGYAEAYNCTKFGETDFLFMVDAEPICAVLYEEDLTGHEFVMFTQLSMDLKIGQKVTQNGKEYSVIGSKPYFDFLAHVAPFGVHTTLYRFTPCLMDYENFPITTTALFGMRKKRPTAGAIDRPSTNMRCSLTQNTASLNDFGATINERDEFGILSYLTSCLDTGYGGCVFGADDTISAIIKNRLAVVVFAKEAVLITYEYVNSVTGASFIKHSSYDPDFNGTDQIINGSLHYFKQCQPFLEYLAKLAPNTTDIIQKTKCNRGFDDALFVNLFNGVGGILIDPEESIRENLRNGRHGSSVKPAETVSEFSPSSSTFTKATTHVVFILFGMFFIY